MRLSAMLLIGRLSLGSVLVACSGEAPPGRDASGAAGAHSTPPDAGRGGPPGVGGPCIPPSEEDATFSGAGISEVIIEGTDNCATGSCLTNHFQGRVTCPFGQDSSDLSLASDDPNRCRLPFQDGSSEAEAVSVTVAPQLTGRAAADAVYCSCRCAGPDPEAPYCACPEGTECLSLIENQGQSSPYTGSYCIKAGTAYDATASYGAPCGLGDPDAGASCGSSNP